MTVSALVIGILEEGVRVRRFPGVTFRDGPTGRRPGLVGGADIGAVIRDVRATPGRGEAKIRRVAADSGLSPAQIRLAVDDDAAFPEDIDARRSAEERAPAQLQELVARRERRTRVRWLIDEMLPPDTAPELNHRGHATSFAALGLYRPTPSSQQAGPRSVEEARSGRPPPVRSGCARSSTRAPGTFPGGRRVESSRAYDPPDGTLPGVGHDPRRPGRHPTEPPPRGPRAGRAGWRRDPAPRPAPPTC